MKKKYPKISIITPSYNQGRFIETTIRSVIEQNYPNLEYIVMDGGSTDETLDILKKYSRQIRLFSKKDKGQSDAINNGLKIAKGEIVGYLNSDDTIEPDSLSKVADFFVKNSQYYWVTGKCYVINENGRIVNNLVTLYKSFWLKYFRSEKILAVLNYISQPATFWKKSVYCRIGTFNHSLHYGMDYDYWLRLIKIYKLGFIDHYLAAFRIHSQSKSGQSYTDLFKESYLVSNKYNSGVLSLLHKFHDICTIIAYKYIRRFK